VKAGCGRLSLKATSKSPLAVTLSRFWYQALRGLTRSPSLALPCSKSKVQTTSRAVKGLPSCHLTPWRSLKRSTVPASSHAHSVARSGTTDFSPLCGTDWSYITRLLKTFIIGPWPAMVDSSWIDIVAGLSKKNTFSTPPDFCAWTGLVTNAAPTIAKARMRSYAIAPSTSETLGAKQASSTLGRTLFSRT